MMKTYNELLLIAAGGYIEGEYYLTWGVDSSDCAEILSAIYGKDKKQVELEIKVRGDEYMVEEGWNSRAQPNLEKHRAELEEWKDHLVKKLLS
jgi:hypothetical protein